MLSVLNRLRITSRLYSGFGALIVIGLFVAVFGVFQLGNVSGEVDKLVAISGNVTRNLEVSRLAETMRRASTRYKFAPNEASLADYKQAVAQAVDLLAAAGKVTTSDERRRIYAESSSIVSKAASDFEKLVALEASKSDNRSKLFAGGDELRGRTQAP